MELSSPLRLVKGVGPALAEKLATLGLENVEDLLLNFPRRYDDFSNLSSIKNLKPGSVTIQAEIKEIKGRYVRRGLHITEAVACDQTGSVRLIWFNQPYRQNQTKLAVQYFITGNFEFGRQRLAIMNPSVELVSDFPVNTARIVPVYRQTRGLKSTQIRRLIREVMPMVNQLPETLPSWLISQYSLESRHQALRAIHFPDDDGQLGLAKARLGFEEVFQMTLASLLNKYEILKTETLKIPFNQGLARQFVGHLPFKLTDDQRRVVWQIYQDLDKGQPMNRLVEGDVGSGKTVVAVMAALMAMEQGFQAALMAPTELLARQHAESIYQLLEPLGYAGQVGLLVGSLSADQKKLAHQQISKGVIRLIIGTHALIQDKVDMHNLGLIVIDEQHRFGVDQRKKLQAKAGHLPHVLNLTATPIPRSLALTLYGEMDISIIASKPANRRPIITELISPHSRNDVYAAITAELKKGHQAFVVCPIINPSDSLPARSAEQVYQEFTERSFNNWKVGLLHGKLKAEAKNNLMQDFASGKLDILVTTTVIEVGVDVPNATVMLIESAERFGLAQIHQLRGRVGRSHQQAYCFLIPSDSSQPSQRLKALERNSDGFRLAQMDLELRGPGAIYGTFQHGALDLRIASLSDSKLIARARQAAQEFIDRKENLLEYQELYEKTKALRAITNLN